MDAAPEHVADSTTLLAIVTGNWKTQAAYVAARLRLPDLLSESPRTAEDLAAATATHPSSLARLLRALAAIDIVLEREDGSFELTSMGGLLRDDAPDSLRAWVLHWGGSSWRAWGDLLHSVTTGESARSLVSGSAGFEGLASDPEAADTFHRAMVELTRLVVRDFVQAVDWTETRKIVDVGGGYGELLIAALTASPGSVGVLFDEPHAVERGRMHLRAAGVEHRCEFLSGDFFKGVPGGGDTYMLKSVLHDWSDERATAILESCRRAMGTAGRLLIVERIVPERVGSTVEDQALACMDLHMLVQHGSRERSAPELRDLLAGAGFRVASTKPLQSTLAVIEAVPADCA